MFTSIKAQAVHVAMAFGITISCFSASAKQITFQEYVDGTVRQNTEQVEQQLFSEIKQDIYFSALAYISKDVSVIPTFRPVVRISAVADAEEE